MKKSINYTFIFFGIGLVFYMVAYRIHPLPPNLPTTGKLLRLFLFPISATLILGAPIILIGFLFKSFKASVTIATLVFAIFGLVCALPGKHYQVMYDKISFAFNLRPANLGDRFTKRNKHYRDVMKKNEKSANPMTVVIDERKLGKQLAKQSAAPPAKSGHKIIQEPPTQQGKTANIVSPLPPMSLPSYESHCTETPTPQQLLTLLSKQLGKDVSQKQVQAILENLTQKQKSDTPKSKSHSKGQLPTSKEVETSSTGEFKVPQSPFRYGADGLEDFVSVNPSSGLSSISIEGIINVNGERPLAIIQVKGQKKPFFVREGDSIRFERTGDDNVYQDRQNEIYLHVKKIDNNQVEIVQQQRPDKVIIIRN